LLDVLHCDCFKIERHVKEILGVMGEAQRNGYPHIEGKDYVRRQYHKTYSTGCKISFEEGYPTFSQAANYNKGMETIHRTVTMNEPFPVYTCPVTMQDELMSMCANQTCMTIFAEDKVKDHPRKVNFLIAFDSNSNIVGAHDKTGRISYISPTQLKEANNLPKPATPNMK
jgi:hypothetical protein